MLNMRMYRIRIVGRHKEEEIEKLDIYKMEKKQKEEKYIHKWSSKMYTLKI